MSDNAIAPFDASSLRDKVADRIKASFVDLIPEETWKQMVANEIKNLTDARIDGYNRTQTPSQLQTMINAEISRRIKEAIVTALNGQEYQGVWGDGTQQASAVVQEIIKQCAPNMVAALFGFIVNDALQHVRNGMSR